MKLCGYDWPQAGTKQVAYVDGQGQVIELVEGLESPWQSLNLTELTGAPPPGGTVLAGYSWYHGNTKQVVYVDGQGQVIELVEGLESPWQSVNLIGLTGAPPSSGTALAGYGWYHGNTKQVAYVDGQGQVIELVVAAGSPWQWANLTELTGAPLAGQGALAGYDWRNGNTKQVVYVDGQGQVIELVVAAGNPWQWANLTELTGAPLAGQGALAGYAWSAGGTKQVAYVDGQGQVIELVVAAGSPWQWANLTELTGAPLPGGTALVGYDWLNGNTKQVAYVDGQGQVIELVVAAGSPWQWANLTELTGAPLAGQGALAGYGWVWGATKQVAYMDDQGQVIELWVGLSGPWRCRGLSTVGTGSWNKKRDKWAI